MHLKLSYNLMFIITLENMKLHYHLFCKSIFYLFSFSRRKSYIKIINEIAINMKMNDIT
jgi:hypothetical protein